MNHICIGTKQIQFAYNDITNFIGGIYYAFFMLKLDRSNVSSPVQR